MKGKISLEDLVEQFLDQCRSGNVPDIQDFAGAHPQPSGASALEDGLGFADWLAAIQNTPNTPAKTAGV